MKVLLLSSSMVYGRGYLDHAEELTRAFFAGVRRILFVPFALHDRAAYAAKARDRFNAMGLELDSLHDAPDARSAVETAEAFFVGGGNTFRLLKALYDTDVLEPMRARVAAGAPYLGSSAGSNVAGPTIKTTKDMPIVQPPSFDALGIVGFQISPHFLDPDPTSTHMGETQEERILQFHEECATPVAGLREGTHVLARGGSIRLGGSAGARIFRRGRPPVEATPGTELGELLA